MHAKGNDPLDDAESLEDLDKDTPPLDEDDLDDDFDDDWYDDDDWDDDIDDDFEDDDCS